jgi:hypothetical protein
MFLFAGQKENETKFCIKNVFSHYRRGFAIFAILLNVFT